MQFLAVAERSLRSIALSVRPTESEKVIEQSTIIGAIEAHSATGRVLKGLSWGRRVRIAFLTNRLLLDMLGFDRLSFDRGAGFGFEFAKAFVVIGV